MLATLVGFVALSLGEPVQQDVIPMPLMEACGDAATSACRVPGAVSIETATARLGDAPQTYWIDGDVFHAVARREAPLVILCCALQSAMEKVEDSGDLWAISVRVADIGRAVLDLLVIPTTGTLRSEVWRGPAAPPAAIRTEIARDAVIERTIHSAALGEDRRVSIWRPVGQGPMPVIYFADGDADAINSHAGLIGTRIAAGDMPPVMLVGLASGPADKAGMTDQDGHNRRHHEYLEGWDAAIYEAHERFLIEEVMPLAESLGASTVPRERAVAGMSDGAGWAIGMATRHPGLFGGAIALSYGNYGPWLEQRAAEGQFDALYLAAGVFEPGFHDDTTKAADLLRPHSKRLRFDSGVAGHSPAFWDDRLPEAAVWLFGPLAP